MSDPSTSFARRALFASTLLEIRDQRIESPGDYILQSQDGRQNYIRLGEGFPASDIPEDRFLCPGGAH